MALHQYVERGSGAIVNESLLADQVIRFLYDRGREHAPTLFRLLTGSRSSSLLAYAAFDMPLRSGASFLKKCRIDIAECLDPPRLLDTPRKVFERRIRYWECRPMSPDPRLVVSPADARVVTGSLEEGAQVCLKGKFFDLTELIGADKQVWLDAFRDGDFAVFRLTPDKYHYNHTPVAGRILDIYEIEGGYHSCNPYAVVSVVTPFSKNRRVVTIIDSDVPGGTGIGLVAMVEVVALMIGDVVQCYSSRGYENPVEVKPGLFVEKGVPKSLYRPGSSTDLLLFQRGRVAFSRDLLENQRKNTVHSRFTEGFKTPLAETEIAVRSPLARPATAADFEAEKALYERI